MRTPLLLLPACLMSSHLEAAAETEGSRRVSETAIELVGDGLENVFWTNSVVKLEMDGDAVTDTITDSETFFNKELCSGVLHVSGQAGPGPLCDPVDIASGFFTVAPTGRHVDWIWSGGSSGGLHVQVGILLGV